MALSLGTGTQFVQPIAFGMSEHNNRNCVIPTILLGNVIFWFGQSLLITLKIFDVISWDWTVVLFPTIALLLALAIGIAVLLAGIVFEHWANG